MPTTAEPTRPAPPAKPGKKTVTPEQSARAWRETIESIVIAIILAFLFRTFEAEAFVIPTGSMAPTLQGRHRDVVCPECGFRYRSGASSEESVHHHPGQVPDPEVVATVCPICRYTHILNKVDDPNEYSFTGDRILVSKFAYQIGEPERWDPIVFKFPGNPKINYIKRLVALPHEEGRIFHGDVYAKSPGESQEQILRKPPHKVVAMLQLVDDTNYIAPKLIEAKWPSRWHKWHSSDSASPAEWRMAADYRSFSNEGKGSIAWLRYKHLVPFETDWQYISQGQLPPDLQKEAPNKRQGILITDFYAYNVNYVVSRRDYDLASLEPLETYLEFVQKNARGDFGPLANLDNPNVPPVMLGRHWVGDLAVEANVNISSATGEVLLDLVEGGRHHTCRIDVATGIAKLEMDGGSVPFVDGKGQETAVPEATTELKGPGEYHLRLSNCDDEMLLWVNGRVVKFPVPTTYATRPDCTPEYLDSDPLDLAPAGIGTNGAALTVSGLRVLRDNYYIASDGNSIDYAGPHDIEEVTEIFRTPSMWAETNVFTSRREYTFKLGADQFFPLGDNSPESADARSWATGYGVENVPRPTTPPHVRRDLLIGKALVIYWPHAWNRPIPFTPNVERMGVIR